VTSAASAPRVIVGLLGGIASGKSTVARLIERLGPGAVVDADVLAREALDACARDGRLATTLGDWAVRADGTPDRKAIAKRVFSEPPALRALERLTHPAVTARIQSAVEDHRSGLGPRVLVLDVPLLIEVGLDRRCDELWFVEAPDAARFRRAAAGPLRLAEDEVVRRERAQSPLDRKKARADRVIENSGDEASLTQQVEAALRALGITPAAV
jgi:dephospho-CoA kinase